MAPIRRYLRISKYSVLECRIFLENPADGQRWLLKTSDPALPRVIAAVKPLVLPKLREENQRAKSKGKKKKAVKDVIHEDDFDVSIFLTEIGTRHSILTKNKTFREKSKLKSNSNKLSGEDNQQTVTIAEESDEESERLALDKIPLAQSSQPSYPDPVLVDVSDEGSPTPVEIFTNAESDEKKKLGFHTTFEGFSIWGWVLCLLVARKGNPARKTGDTNSAGQHIMEEWIASTQMELNEDD
ncbi:MAG: hypothetical protein Q9160_007045 [Pyrenula sp. 1 TL-2023]